MNPRRLTPSMSSLLAFEASARTESFTKAAAQLSLTQSAVSRQVQGLEALLGISLFQRVGRRVELTDIGRMYFRELSEGLERVRNASLQAMAFQGGGGTLNISVLPTFGSKWLLRRLPLFYARHPEVRINIYSRMYLDLKASGMDASIVVGRGDWEGVMAYPLVAEKLVPIISAKQAKLDNIKRSADLLTYPLLQIVTRPTAWQDWFLSQGVCSDKLNLGGQFDVTSHLIEAVAAGMGIGLVASVLVEDEIQSGSLIEAVPNGSMASGNNYYLVASESVATHPPFVLFRNWLTQTEAVG